MTSTSTAIRFASLLLSALTSGVFFGTRTSLGPSTKTFPAATYVQVQQATIRNLRPVMGVLLPASVAANAVVLVLSSRERRSRDVILTLGGLVSQLTSLLLTAAVELPINAQVLTWSPEEPPRGWEASRDRWHAVHTARTASSVAGLGFLVAAALDPREVLASAGAERMQQRPT